MSITMKSDSAPKRRRRVGVDFHVWDGIFQGSRSHILGLYKSVIRKAPDIDFYFFLENTKHLREQHSEFAADNVTLVSAKHLPGVVRLGVQLPYLQLRHKLDLLHVQYRLPFLKFGPSACTIHDVLFETHPQFFGKGFVRQSKITYRHAARNSDLLFSVSQFSKLEIERLYGPDLSPISVTYNAVDQNLFFPLPGGEDAVTKLGLEPGRYLLTVGRLEPRKNHIALIEAYAELSEDTPPLIIVGQPDFSYEAIFGKIKDLKLTGRVKLLSDVEDQTLPAVIRHALVFVYPAFAEGFGMPVAEAMASGVPVITSNTTSLPEVVGGAALLVDPHSIQDIAAAIRSVLANLELRSNMRKKGLEQVQKFSWEGSADVFLTAVRNFLFR
ncbi:glycosyltransferase family 1 protein [Hydrocarboniphaga sp.]|uniref:glycosyltransferase family 4 protein n=1 Tax=Hydrocarboniphaga sp. TaxID=2033016 RepID=UPI002ABB2DA7|nr:glycosyltransferase family 1 protein [Hydrocarboniphaga sp.]MDZ4078363.1 glycosyltransferase family 1 protein [Hydrocarboniphaga sp.]